MMPTSRLEMQLIVNIPHKTPKFVLSINFTLFKFLKLPG